MFYKWIFCNIYCICVVLLGIVRRKLIFRINFFLFKNIFSKIFKRFYLPYWIWLPSSCGAVFCNLLPEKMLQIDGIGLFDMYVEFLIKQSKLKVVVAMRKSKVCATLIYSLFNAIIMYGLFDTKANRFWFSTFVHKKGNQQIGENSEINPKKNLNCYHHDGTCEENYKKVKYCDIVELTYRLNCNSILF